MAEATTRGRTPGRRALEEAVAEGDWAGVDACATAMLTDLSTAPGDVRAACEALEARGRALGHAEAGRSSAARLAEWRTRLAAEAVPAPARQPSGGRRGAWRWALWAGAAGLVALLPLALFWAVSSDPDEAESELYPGPCRQPGSDDGVHYDARRRPVRVVQNGATLHSYEYDRDGRLVKEHEHSTGEDPPAGVICQTTRYTFDAAGRRVREETDGAIETCFVMPDGQPDRIVRHHYGDDGRLTRTEIDGFWEVEAPDGHADTIVTYEYDAQGRVVSEVSSGAAFCGVADGPVRGRRWTRSFRYDAAGRKTSMTTTGDTECEGDNETYEYDARGNLTIRRFDWNVDGVVDRIETYDYGCWEAAAH